MLKYAYSKYCINCASFRLFHVEPKNAVAFGASEATVMVICGGCESIYGTRVTLDQLNNWRRQENEKKGIED